MKKIINSSGKVNWTLFSILLVGFVIRLALSISRNDLVWPDEHFMSLEPASKIVFGRAYLAWEWQTGYRAWTFPLLYVPALWLCSLFGVSGGIVPIYAGRFFTALASGVGLLLFYRVLYTLRLRPWVRWVTLGVFALMPQMVLWSPTALADHWLMLSWLALVPPLYRMSLRKDDFTWLKMGVLAGLPVLIKYQGGVFAFALGLGFLFQRKSLRQLILFSVGVLLNPLGIGILDWFTYDKFFSTLIAQVSRGEVTARFYGVSPWYDYFPRLISFQGEAFLLLVGVSFVLAMVQWQGLKNFLNTRGKLVWMLVGPSGIYFLIHSAIPHKETRFLFPVLPLLYATVGVGLHLSPIFSQMRVVIRRGLRGWRVSRFVGPVVVPFFGCFSFYSAWQLPLDLTPVNIASLENRIYELQGQTGRPSSCLLLMEHHFSWTRGKLILGDGVELVEKHVSEYSPDQDARCNYAILPYPRLEEFRSRAPSTPWDFEMAAPNGYVLLKKNRS